MLFTNSRRKRRRLCHIGTCTQYCRAWCHWEGRKLQAAQQNLIFGLRNLTRCIFRRHCRNRCNVHRGCTTTSAHNIQQSGRQIILNRGSHHLRRLTISALVIRQSRIGMRRYRTRRHSRHPLDIRTHSLCSVSTIQADRNHVTMMYRSIKCLNGLPCQCTSTGISQRSGNHNRDRLFALLRQFFNSKNGSFDIQCIKEGFQQNQICSTIHQTTRLIIIGL